MRRVPIQSRKIAGLNESPSEKEGKFHFLKKDNEQEKKPQ